MSDSPLPSRRRPHHEVRAAVGRPTLAFLTVCTKDRRPVLANEAAHSLIVEHWRRASACHVGRYVIMPDHVHLFATPGEPELPLETWVVYWKRMVARTLGTGVWQDGYWDYTLRTSDSCAEKWVYVRDNPVRLGLVGRCEDWAFAGELNEFVW